MKTEALDRCLELFRAVEDFEVEKVLALSDLDAELHEAFVEPFRRELALNLLSKPSFQEKKDLIIFYIEELDRSILFDRYFSDIEPVNDDFQHSIWYDGDYETDDLGIARVRAHILFSLLFGAIQDNCNIYQIPFIKICKERNFILESIDLSPTKDFEELSAFAKESEKKLQELASADTDLQELKTADANHQEVTSTDTIPPELPSAETDRPMVSREYLKEVYEILRDFFSPEDQIVLLSMFENNVDAEKPLVFLSSNNRLADAFKQLYTANIICGCMKKDLIRWICRNFNYTYRNTVKSFIPKYLKEIISTNKDKCAKPFLNVKFDKVQNKHLLIRL